VAKLTAPQLRLDRGNKAEDVGDGFLAWLAKDIGGTFVCGNALRRE
jgi:hypothetical protein